MDRFEFKVALAEQGQRLDKFLLEKLVRLKPEISRSRIKLLMEQGQVSSILDDKIVKYCSLKIKSGDKFAVIIPEVKESKITPQNIDFEIVFEDQDMLVINKPAGLTTHPGNGKFDQTLVNALLFKVGDRLSGINGVMRPGIVHRLDKDTSGLMVVAKSDLAHKNLAAQIENRTLKRHYLALCYGLPKPLKGKIENNMERCHKNRLKMVVVRSGGKKAITNYEVQKTYFNGLLSLVECKLDTGRTHQIRVAMNEIGHPLVGDQLYGNKRRYLGELSEDLQKKINKFPRQFLHSYKISFLHPLSNTEMNFEIDLTNDLRDLLSLFR